MLFAATALLRSGQEAYQRYQPRSHYDAAAQEGRQVKPPVVIGLAPPETSPKSYDPEQYGDQADLIAQRWMAWAAVALLIVTTIGVFLVGITVWQTRGVLSEAKKATSAANRTIDETKRIGEVQTRAWITEDQSIFEPINFSGKPEGPFGGHCVVKWVNTGHSPAINLRVYSDFVIVPRGTPAPSFPQKIPFTTFQGVLGEKCLITTDPKVFRPEILASLIKKQSDCYVYSKVAYQTIFDKPGENRLSEFCALLDFSTGTVDDAAKGTSKINVGLVPIGLQNTIT